MFRRFILPIAIDIVFPVRQAPPVHLGTSNRTNVDRRRWIMTIRLPNMAITNKFPTRGCVNVVAEHLCLPIPFPNQDGAPSWFHGQGKGKFCSI